ncbi:MAG: hypothetical protein ACLFS6_06575 [Methanomassiliicoccales archaeon]
MASCSSGITGPRWAVIARNEFRLRTSSIRGIRKAFLPLVFCLLGLFVLVIAPAAARAVLGENTGLFDIEGVNGLISVTLLAIFLAFITFPITRALQEKEVPPQEVLLSSPVEPKDILLGSFMGALPLYFIPVVLVAGSFTAVLSLVGVDLLQMLIIVAVFIMVFTSALWIGTVIAAVIQGRLNRVAGGRDMGKAVALLLALPLVGIMYALMSGGVNGTLGFTREGLLGMVLELLPPSWGADLVIGFALHPGDWSVVWIDTLFIFGGLMLFVLVSLLLGCAVANRAYTLEPYALSPSKIRKEGRVFRAIRFLGRGGGTASLVNTVMKDYGRRLENISQIIYIVGLVFLVDFFLLSSMEQVNMIPNLMMLSWIIPFLTVFVIGEVTVRGKSNLFIYRKAPRGERRLIWARLLQGWIIVLPLAAVLSLILNLSIPGISLQSLLFLTVAVVLFSMGHTAMALGIFLLFPVFSDKPSKALGNAMVLMMTSIFLFLPLVLFLGLQLGLALFVILISILGALLLGAGRVRLGRIE